MRETLGEEHRVPGSTHPNPVACWPAVLRGLQETQRVIAARVGVGDRRNKAEKVRWIETGVWTMLGCAMGRNLCHVTRLDKAVDEDIGSCGQSIIECRRSGSSIQRIGF